ncbi:MULTISPECIES: flagellar export chaperone FlgN [Actinosynnema]|uniref:FlgN family protein n=2 Tax=Actinosynnema TaxID=40566 RepID=C6WJS1_ACTMD|nr:MULTISPECIES: flagellar export chaperone FlgN [Actinosynnema]ACU36296.1 FlgN family protein [Actinosynnema mirum DSM 43827]AXX29749.1 hypothetical protein APASM_2384 [Actinosynnema pretiosum subsp. pretiosum]MCP2099538.1 FlgN protein [Actinosynnema pretiosum]QUF06034.1 flagellar export chaperone FlgN [Actinosynnema pretiosum subsp. pretiosum]
MGLSETSTILWRQRELLTMLLYKLEVESLVLAAGRTRWLGAATREAELVLEQVQRTELLRTIETDELAAELGLRPGASLAELADAVPDSWREVFTEHRKGLVAIAAEIDAITRSNKEQLTAGQRAVNEALRFAGGASGLYRADGSTASGVPMSRLVDEAV